jgi:hypothetical protein
MLIEKWSDIKDESLLNVTVAKIEHNVRSFKNRRFRVHMVIFKAEILGVEFRRSMEVDRTVMVNELPFPGQRSQFYGLMFTCSKKQFEEFINRYETKRVQNV